MAISEAWAARLHDVLRGPLAQIDEATLKQAVGERVREGADLDFKQQLYGGNAEAKRNLAGDVAALANERGGLIVLGVRDEDEAAVELTPVALSGDEERRMKQIIADNVSPHVVVQIQPVERAEDPSSGWYLLIVPPSSRRPHAVVTGKSLRYPRRDGAITRYLQEPEVAAMYRDRVSEAKDQVAQLDSIIREGTACLYPKHEPWVVMALLPDQPGSGAINREERERFAEWAHAFRQPPGVDPTAGILYDQIAGVPQVGIGVGRLTIPPLGGVHRKKAKCNYHECYTSGAGFAARTCRRSSAEEAQVVVTITLFLYTVMMLRFLVAHAKENAGTFGDAVADLRLIGTSLVLGYEQEPYGVHTFDDSPELEGPVSSRQTVSLDAAYGSPRDLLSTASLLLSDIVHAFGRPEVVFVRPDGTLRVRYLQESVRDWAEQNGVPVTDETVAP